MSSKKKKKKIRRRRKKNKNKKLDHRLNCEGRGTAGLGALQSIHGESILLAYGIGMLFGLCCFY